MTPDAGTEAADLKVIETAATLRAVLLEEQAARSEAEAAAERKRERAAAAERKLLADQHRREKRWVITGAAIVFVFGVLMSSLLVAGHVQRQDVLEGFERARQDGIDVNIATIHCLHMTGRDFQAFERCVRASLPAPP